MQTGRQSGWTLLEGLWVLAILSVLAGVALPAGHETIGRWRVQTAISDFTHALLTARREAVRRGRTVLLQRRDDCVQRDWSCGWMVFEDGNRNFLLDKEDSVIMFFDPPPGVQVSTNAPGLRLRLRLAANGTSHGVQAGSFFFRYGAQTPCTRLLLSAGLRWRTEGC